MNDPLLLDAARTALLVMDFQPGILARLADGDDLVARARSVVDQARAAGATIGWVRVGLDDADADAVPATSTFAAMASPERRAAMHADAPGTQVDSRLGALPTDVVVRKVRIGSFTTTDLDAQLRSRGVDTLLLAGVSTSGVVLSTVREALDRDYRIVVASDLCADPDPELHAVLVVRVFPPRAAVVLSDDVAWA